jgi:uncharacterized membrane protein
MVLMVVDHVRVFAGVPAGSPEPAVFLTRWITHFCAPWFVFFAGTSAYLHGLRLGDKSALSRWLVTRGLWIVLLELTVVRLAWTFNFDYAHYMLAGVLWMLGWCMVGMALLVHLPMRMLTMLGLAVVFGHNLISMVSEATVEGWLAGPMGAWLRIKYFGGGIALGGAGEPNFFVLYSLVPWIGVMACGYALGAVLQWPEQRRNRFLVRLGAAAVALFFILRLPQLYGDWPWRFTGAEAVEWPLWIQFLNASKYPASLHFLLMTLGPALLLMPWLERVRGAWTRPLEVFGRVPFFFYLLHIPLIHLLALGIAAVRTPESIGWLFANHPLRPGPPPEGYRWSLGLLYLVTAGVVAALYVPCREFAKLKATSPSRWLTYVSIA